MFAVSAFVSLAQPPNAAQAAFQRGVELERAGDLVGARAQYEKSIQLDPSRLEAQGNLGMVLLRAGQPDAAIASFEKVLERRPDVSPVRFYLALAQFQAGRTDAARGNLAKVLAASPIDAQAWHLDGLCLLKLNRLEEGAAALERAVRENPSNGSAILTLATTYVSLKEVEKAEALLHGPLAGQDVPETKLVRGMILNARQEYKDAEIVLAEAAAARPSLPTLRYSLGYARMRMGDFRAAALEFEAELKNNPGDFLATANLGWVLMQEHEYERAAPLVAAALQQSPTNPGLLFLSGQLALSREDLPQAAVQLEKAVAQQPEYLAAHVLLARVYRKQGRQHDLARVSAVVAELNAAEKKRGIDPRAIDGSVPMQAPEFASPEGRSRQ